MILSMLTTDNPLESITSIKSNPQNQTEIKLLVGHAQTKPTNDLDVELKAKSNNIGRVAASNPTNYIIPEDVTNFYDYMEKKILAVKISANISDFKLQKNIGSGSFGSVYDSVHINSSAYDPFVIKRIDKKNKHYKPIYIVTEIFLQTYLIHPNIVRCKGWFDDYLFVYIIFEKINGPNMTDYRLNKGGCLPIDDVATYMRQIVDAMVFIKSRGVIYFDMKPENIIVDTSINKAYLCDFGLASIINHNDSKIKIQSIVGTLDFISPEIVSVSYIDYKTDVWSIGATIYEIIFDVAPFFATDKYGKDITETMIQQIKYTLLPKKYIHTHKILYEYLCDLFKKIFVYSNQRISIDECAEHLFFTCTKK